MVPKIYQPLLKSLERKSEAKTLKWLPTEADNEFALGLSQYTLSLRLEYDSVQKEDLLIFSLFNSSGSKLDSFLVAPKSRFWPTLKEIFFTAQNSVKGLDSAIQSIIEELEASSDVGRPLPGE